MILIACRRQLKTDGLKLKNGVGEEMVLKGFISAINEYDNTAEVILPEYGNVVTAPLKLYNRSAKSLNIGDFVIVAMFDDNDLCDGVIL